MNSMLQEVVPAGYAIPVEHAPVAEPHPMRRLGEAAASSKMLIAGVVAIFAMAALLYAFFSPPVYEASFLVQIEDPPPTTDRILGEAPRTADPRSATASEMEVLQSRMVVERAVDELKLYIDFKPRYFPLIGERLAALNKQLTPTRLIEGPLGYTWGSDAAMVSQFDVPQALLGTRFILAAASGGGFVLRHDALGEVVHGSVGKAAQFNTAAGPVTIKVDSMHATPGAQFLLTRRDRIDTIESLQGRLKIVERGKQSGVIRVSMQDRDRVRAAAILEEISRQYLRQNQERKSEGAEKALAFLERQLPELKQAVETAESRYNELRNRAGTVNLGEEARGLLQLTVTMQTKLLDLGQRKQELATRYESAHPLMAGVEQQIKSVNAELAGVNRRIRELPQVEQAVLRLSRDVKVNTEIYTAALATAQQLRLASASKIGNVRLLDAAAVPATPLNSHPGKLLAIGSAVGLLAGLLLAFARKLWFGRVDLPSEVENRLGLAVTATIPHSQGQASLIARARSARPGSTPLLLHDSAPGDLAIESLRRFRSSLQYSLGAQQRVLVVTGPSPGVGKSFVASNLSAVLAAAGKKVLLVDGDLRNGNLHRSFSSGPTSGLADYLAGQLPLESVIRRNAASDVDFIPAGTLPSDPAELLCRPNFDRLLNDLSHYDYVVIDTAPVLLVADALSVAASAHTTFIVARSGVTTAAEIEETSRQLGQVGARVAGVVLNDCRSRFPRYSYSASYGAATT